MATSGNLLLDSLSPNLLKSVLQRARPVALPVRSALYEPEVPPTHVYFLTSGLASVVTASEEGINVEVEVIGCEGMGGSVHLLGSSLVPSQCFMQLPGSALQMGMGTVREVFLQSAEFRERVLAFVQVQALTLGQIAGCHRMHSAEQRLARWLLMVQDRVSGDTLHLTQEFLAEMLGSQRTTVSVVAAEMQKLGTIEYSRGRLKITDRPALEKVSCGCYGVTQQLLKGLYATPASLREGMPGVLPPPRR